LPTAQRARQCLVACLSFLQRKLANWHREAFFTTGNGSIYIGLIRLDSIRCGFARAGSARANP
jgi:hypothetical protein